MIAKPSAPKDSKNAPKADPKVLVIDVGGTHVKLLMTGQKEPTKFVSGPSMTAARAVRDIKLAVKGWKFDCISIGYPGPIINSHPLREPHNLGSGIVRRQLERTFAERQERLVRLILNN